MGIKIRNVEDKSILRKFFISVDSAEGASAGDGAAYGVAPTLATGFTGVYVVPVECRLAKHTWVHIGTDFTASEGLAVNIDAPIQSATLVHALNVWSASDDTHQISGSDWSANRPHTTIIPYNEVTPVNSVFLTAGSLIRVKFSATADSGMVQGILEFECHDRKQV